MAFHKMRLIIILNVTSPLCLQLQIHLLISHCTAGGGFTRRGTHPAQRNVTINSTKRTSNTKWYNYKTPKESKYVCV
jgi:hypothetical protein